MCLKFLTIIILIMLTSACSHIQSGHHIKLRSNDNLDRLVKEFRVPHAAILNANRDKSWRRGQWIFIPQIRGFLSRLIGYSPVFGPGRYSRKSFLSGKFLWPVPSSRKVTSLFGERRWGESHEGLDISSSERKYILAAENGIVSFSGYDKGGYGNILMIDHDNGHSTVYAHALAKLVKPGQKVYRGQVIGLIGSTGRSTGPHLHFEVRKNGKKIDPLPLLLDSIRY